MTPHQAQGGTQSIEDGEAFKLFDRENVDRDAVESLLKDFDRVRRSRASRIQNDTRESQQRKDKDTLYKNTKYNFTYPGVEECLSRLNAGQEMIV